MVVRKLPPNEGTNGVFIDPLRRKKTARSKRGTAVLVKAARARRKDYRGLSAEELTQRIGGHTAVMDIKARARKEMEKEIKQRQHPLSFDVLTRFEVRHRLERGEALHVIAKDLGTSPTVIRKIGEMDDKLPKGREAEIIQHFYRLSGMLERMLGSVSDEDLQGASLGMKFKGVDMLSDKLLSIRKGLDGEAPKRVQVDSHHESLLKFGGREGVIEAIRQSFERLKPFVEAEVVEEDVKQLPVKVQEFEQLDLFTDQKMGT